jgi:polyhydroxyalkanoate synthase
MKNPLAKTYRVLTDDGWEIALHRYPKRTKRKPVLLVHGLGSNRYNLDFPKREKSLAKYLWTKGWDTWIIELRGAGVSTRPSGLGWLRRSWGIDHYVLHDLPSAIRFILKETGHQKLHWIGHSLGGMLVIPFLRLHSTSVLKSVVAAASPLVTGIRSGYFRWTFLIDPLLRFLPFAPHRTVVNLIHLSSRWFYGKPHQALYVKENMERQTMRIGARIAIDDLSSDVMRQFHGWMRNEKFVSSDGKIRYFIDFEKLRIPFLIVTGSHDPFTPSEAMKRIYRRIGSRKKGWLIFGKEYGHASNYGHLDLILGRHAIREVYPAITKWLREND